MNQAQEKALQQPHQNPWNSNNQNGGNRAMSAGNQPGRNFIPPPPGQPNNNGPPGPQRRNPPPGQYGGQKYQHNFKNKSYNKKEKLGKKDNKNKIKIVQNHIEEMIVNHWNMIRMNQYL